MGNINVTRWLLAGLFPDSLLLKWGAIGLVEMVVATLVGGWLYREP